MAPAPPPKKPPAAWGPMPTPEMQKIIKTIPRVIPNVPKPKPAAVKPQPFDVRLAAALKGQGFNKNLGAEAPMPAKQSPFARSMQAIQKGIAVNNALVKQDPFHFWRPENNPAAKPWFDARLKAREQQAALNQDLLENYRYAENLGISKADLNRAIQYTINKFGFTGGGYIKDEGQIKYQNGRPGVMIKYRTPRGTSDTVWTPIDGVGY